MPQDPQPPDHARMEELVVTLAGALSLRLEPEWVAGVAQQLMITLAMAEQLEAIDLDDEAQPASVYRL